MYGLYGNGYGMGIFGWVWMVIGWIIAIAIIASIIRWLVGGSRWHRVHGRGCCGDHMLDNDDSAMTILREKYAKGEVTRKEFLDRKKDLMMDQDEEETKEEDTKK